jgi:hypothetical protein
MSLNQILKSRIWPAAWQVFVRFYALLILPLLAGEWMISPVSSPIKSA